MKRPARGKSPQKHAKTAQTTKAAALLEKDNPSRWKAWTTRLISSLPMVASFFFLTWVGHWAIAGLAIFIEFAIFHELLKLSYNPDVTLDKTPIPLGSKVLNWIFFSIAIYFDLGRYFFGRFPGFFYGLHPLFKIAVDNHYFISFWLMVSALVLFVLSLEKDYYRVQFKQLVWALMSIGILVFLAQNWIRVTFNGLIWFFLPTSMIICNDIWAYWVGFIVGRTPLIQLSPKKTWEGFIGALIATLFFSLVFSRVLSQYQHFICPKEDLTTFTVVCQPSSTFLWHDYHVPTLLQPLLGPTITARPMDLHALVFGLWASLVAPFGGFFASGFKRAFAIKDFGDVFPGHGGFTDRFDCQLLTAAFVWLYYRTFIQRATLMEVLPSISELSEHDQRALMDTLMQKFIG